MAPNQGIEPEGRTIDVDGIRTFVIDQGDGPPLVFIHGSTAGIDAHLTWYPTIERLSDRFRCIAFDQIGFGRTDMPADGSYKNRFERASHAIALLDALDLRNPILIGHSEGAVVAFLIAIERPDLVNRLIIVTSGSASPNIGGDKDDAWMESAGDAYDHNKHTATEDAFIESWRPLNRNWDARFEAILRANYRLALESGNITLFRNLPESETDMRHYSRVQETDLFPHFDKLTLPIDIIWADQDTPVPIEKGVALRALVPHADLHILANAGHMIMHDRPETFAELVGCVCGR